MENYQVKEYVLGVIYGSGFHYSDYQGKHDSKVWIYHKQEFFLNNLMSIIDAKWNTKMNHCMMFDEKYQKYNLTIDNEQLWQWCEDNGAKTVNTKKYEQLPQLDNYSHFIRGLYESSGKIWVNGNDDVIIEFKHKSEQLLNNIRNAIADVLEINIDDELQEEYSKYVLRIKDQNQVRAIVNWLYADCNLYSKGQKAVYPFFLSQRKYSEKTVKEFIA